MKYPNIAEGIFLSRPNRFIALVEVEGRTEVCHVKNTGRCKELLVPGYTVWLSASDNPNRKTRFDLVTVMRQGKLINMDSQAPNAVFAEHLQQQGVPFGREQTYGASRFDFFLPGQEAYVEVKGITLERDGACLFPDAPTERGVRHVEELMAAKAAGYSAGVCFIIQMEDVRYVSPNEETHPAFGAALRRAAAAGVALQAWDCCVTPCAMEIGKPVEIRL